MKIIINESQLKTIHNSLNEAALPSFSLEELSKIQSFKGKQQYCSENLGKPIGNGSSRQVFQIDDNKVLKLAKNTKGIKQNEYEGADDYYKSSLSIFPEVFEHDENYSWIVSDFNDYIGSYSVGIGDFYAIQNYGLALRENQPQIVILDSGLSEDIYNSYYKRD